MINLDTITEEALLNCRMCELPISIENTWLNNLVQELYQELTNNNLLFKPKCYLADEWLTPDQEPVIGLPFYLAHPTLVKLEKKMMLEAEGNSKDWAMKLLRHECGHAINYAFKFYKKRKWQNIFGKFTEEYGDSYRFRPYSKAYVRHLEDYYAQYHPDEDFAETFAVWLTPELDWKTKYKGWPALNKLNYVNELMTSIKNTGPVVQSAKPYWQASKLKRTLKNHYKKRQAFHAEDFPHYHDTNLKRIFTTKDKAEKPLVKAYLILKKHRKLILESMSRWTGEKKYVTNDLLNKLILRSKNLDLYLADPEPITTMRIATYMASLLMNYMYTGRWAGNK